MTTPPFAEDGCPGHDALRYFTLGDVREAEVAALEAHLACCPDCVATLHEIKAEDTLVDAMRAQASLATRPRIDNAVILLMDLLKGWQPSLSFQDAATSSASQTEVEQEVISFLAPAEQPDEIGRLGSYRVLKVLGSGGMGVVFEAEDTQLRRPVALKALRPVLAANSTARKRFEQEARAAAALTHDNVVTIYQVGNERGIPFLAMPYLAGETLAARLRREVFLPLADIVRIGRELALGLSAAHAQGLLHRDVKPANIWLESREVVSGEFANADCSPSRVKLLDFGLAWFADNADPLTEHGTVVGTPPYMAPEQARGEAADVRSDLFSLGSVLYSMCTGQAPFQAGSNLAILEKVRTEFPRPIRDINPSIPQWLIDVVAKLHAKNPGERCQSAVEVAALLKDLGQKSGDARQAAAVSGQRTARGVVARRRWWAAAAMLLLSVVGLTFCEAMGMTHLRHLVVGRLAFREPASANMEPPSLPANGPPARPQEPAPPLDKAPGAPAATAQQVPTIYPAALFPFEERGAGVHDIGSKVADILFARLAARPELHLVDRTDLNKILGELELNISGVVKPMEANKIGQLTGAKILISGSVFQVDKRTYLVAKIVGTETGRVLGASVDGKTSDELASLVEKLAEQVAETIAKKGDLLVAKVTPKVDRIVALKMKLKGERPAVWIKISERHVGGIKIDPAVETEVSKFCKETGFTLIDSEEGVKGKAEIWIVGEAISETAARNGNLVSVKARVEIRAIDRKTDTILAVDRQTALVVDLTENIAAKAALAEAAAILAERLLPKLVK